MCGYQEELWPISKIGLFYICFRPSQCGNVSEEMMVLWCRGLSRSALVAFFLPFSVLFGFFVFFIDVYDVTVVGLYCV